MKFLGRAEKIELPELEISEVWTKIDTGAFGNALHCDLIELIDGSLHFTINEKKFIFRKYKTAIIKNSFGEKQKRFLIFTKIMIGDKKYKVYLSLTDRKNMRYPMLIGRRFLYKFGYLVDVKKKNTYDRPKKM